MIKEAEVDGSGGVNQNKTIKRSLYKSNLNKRIDYLNPDARNTFT